MIAAKFQTLLDKLEPYIFSFGGNFQYFDRSPLSKEVKSENLFDCTKTATESFYNLLRQMDAITFGDQGMAMDGWMYFDCSAMPGAITGFGIQQNALPKSLLEKLKIPSEYKGIIPISMFIAIPMLGESWFGHNLSSLKSELGEEYAGLGLLTKAMGIKILKIKTMYGATQWNSPAIHIHSQLADMELVTAITPVHTHRNSLCYKSIYTNKGIEEALSGKSRKALIDFKLISGTDFKFFEQIQLFLEKDKKVIICGRPETSENETYYPLKFEL